MAYETVGIRHKQLGRFYLTGVINVLMYDTVF